MKVSIALATYNGAKFLEEQLESYSIQTKIPDEIIICDDGSDDKTIEIIKRYSANNLKINVKIYQNEIKLGHEQNFSRCINLATGEIIFLSDQDDVWTEDKIKSHLEIYEENQNIITIINDLEIVDEKLNGYGRTVVNQMKSTGTYGENGKSFIIGCATSFRSSVKEIFIPVPNLSFGHDKWIHDFSEILNARKIIYKNLQKYRRHSDNSSSWVFDNQRKANWKDMLMPSIGKNMVPSYQKEIQIYTIMKERILKIEDDKYLKLQINLGKKEVINKIENKIKAIEKRLKLLESNIINRKIIALSMLVKGEYKFFLGWRSFIKDLIR